MDTEIQRVRATLIEKRDAFQKAIDAFDAALGLATFGCLLPDGNGALKRPTDRPTEQTPRQRVARSLPDDADLGKQETGRRQKILALLQDGPLGTKAVASSLGIDKALIKMCLQRMKKVGLVKSIGVRAGSKWTLPGKAPAKEGH